MTSLKMKRLFVFNPDCELAIANGDKHYMPPQNIVQMADDLAFLPAYFGGEGDYVLVKKKPDSSFEENCHKMGVRCRSVVEEEIGLTEIVLPAPWGWSPKICHQFLQWGISTDGLFVPGEWYSRKVAREGLLRLFPAFPELEQEIVPQVCYRVEEVERCIADGVYVVKAPWSSSGKGLLTLHKQIATKEREWISGVLRRQKYIMVEKRLDKVSDFAMEFLKEDDRVEFIGWSVFETGEKGEYKGNYLGSQEKMEEMLSVAGEDTMTRLKSGMAEMLNGLLPSYHGYLGVDMMLYRNESGEIRLQPCLEINLRYNMGILALFLSQHYLSPEAQGRFKVSYYPVPGEAFREHLRMQQEKPTVYKNNRIVSGYLNLTPVNAATQFVASLVCY